MPSQKLTNEIIDAAILGFEEQKRRIDRQINDLRALRSGEPAEPEGEPAKPRRRVSAAARKKMAAGQRRRWAAIKDGAEAEASAVSKPKRKLSAAGRAAIAAAQKKRWAARKAAAKK
jgi:hypothetical protein